MLEVTAKVPEDLELLRNIASDSNTSEEILLLLAKMDNEVISLAILQNPKISKTLIEELAESKHAVIQEKIKKYHV